jgi:hypothetical protein
MIPLPRNDLANIFGRIAVRLNQTKGHNRAEIPEKSESKAGLQLSR